MRQVVLDTETTGLSHEDGHRIIELGCVALKERRFTGEELHFYFNPEREMDAGAFAVHGISNDFLKDKPFFKDKLEEFIAFIEGSEIIIHNAAFDLGFLNAEFRRIGWSRPIESYCTVIDTLFLARKKHPGQRNSLDALCKRYDIDNSARVAHGALLDAKILSHVYLAMTGGQSELFDKDLILFEEEKQQSSISSTTIREPLPLLNTEVIRASGVELAEHEKFIQFLIEKSGLNLWLPDLPGNE